MAYNTFQIRLDYDIRHGRRNPIYFRNLWHNLPNSTNLRDFLLDIILTPIGDHHASGIYVYLYKPRTYYIEEGIERPVDKWGTYPIDTNAIPPAITVVSGGEELRRDTPASEFDLVKWANKYWTLVPGSYWHDHVDDPANYDRQVNPGWPGYRSTHSFIFGFDYDDSAIIYFPAPFRLTSHITGFGERYMLLITLWRGNRNIKKVIEFSLLGAPTNSDLLTTAYLPVAIVYCPPGQDMSNSLIETQRHGTRFTFESRDMSTATWAQQSGISASLGIQTKRASAGVKAEHEEGATESQSITDSSTSVINLQKMHETMITANNRTAIGRAYWGPLGDLFVIIKDLLFYGYQVFDEETGIAMLPIPESPNARKLVLSTRELLRPGNGSATIDIPWDQRKRILKLNPFVVDDDTILDQVANGSRPLEDAVNPDADPNRTNPTRAIKVLSLDLGKGTEVNFYESRGVEITRAETHATSYTTTFTSATDLAFELEIPIVGVGFGAGFSTEESISYQTTAEIREVEEKIETAKCYLIRNQNDPNDRFLDVYYDTIFGTFLFSKRDYSSDCVSIVGKVSNQYKVGIKNMSVRILDKDKKLIAQTKTNVPGVYRIPCVMAQNLKDKFYIQAGDKEEEVKVKKEMIKKRAIRKDIANAKRLIDLESSTYEEVMEIFDIDLEEVNRLSHALNKLTDEKDILGWLNLDKKQYKKFQKSNKIIWTEESRKQLAKRGKRPPKPKKMKSQRKIKS